MAEEKKATGKIKENELNFKTDIHAVLMGDSVLDTFYWLSDKRRDVRFELDRLLKEDNKNAKCTNLAVDESTIYNVLYGIQPNRGYVRSRAWNKLEPYPVDNAGFVRPLYLVRNLKDPTHVILSIGGNDARAAFASSFNLEGIYKRMMDQGIIDGFERLVTEVTKVVPNIILVIVYHPLVTSCPIFHMLPKASVITELIVRFTPMFLDIAKKFKLPVIDLARTFNPHDSRDYGSTPIEPSNRSGLYIAEMARHIIRTFQFGKEDAKIYTGLVSDPDGDESNWRPLKAEVIDESFKDLEKYRTSLNKHMEDGRSKVKSACVIS